MAKVETLEDVAEMLENDDDYVAQAVASGHAANLRHQLAALLRHIHRCGWCLEGGPAVDEVIQRANEIAGGEE